LNREVVRDPQVSKKKLGTASCAPFCEKSTDEERQDKKQGAKEGACWTASTNVKEKADRWISRETLGQMARAKFLDSQKQKKQKKKGGTGG